MNSQTSKVVSKEEKAKLLKQASLVATLASIIGLGVAIYESAALGSALEVLIKILVPLASLLPLVALSMIAMKNHGLTTQSSRIATWLVVCGGVALFAFSIAMLFV
jgi:hypothetical protein|tara:strand:- start:389 stop:706 length:318 start_codon:yes stop_codon:yes gene_type:complete